MRGQGCRVLLVWLTNGRDATCQLFIDFARSSQHSGDVAGYLQEGSLHLSSPHIVDAHVQVVQCVTASLRTS
jgi:hypothetical protein